MTHSAICGLPFMSATLSSPRAMIDLLRVNTVGGAKVNIRILKKRLPDDMIASGTQELHVSQVGDQLLGREGVPREDGRHGPPRLVGNVGRHGLVVHAAPVTDNLDARADGRGRVCEPAGEIPWYHGEKYLRVGHIFVSVSGSTSDWK